MGVQNITDTADHLLYAGVGHLRRVVLNTPAATSTLKVYDGRNAQGVLIATIDGTATARSLDYDADVLSGIFAKATGAADWTVVWGAA